MHHCRSSTLMPECLDRKMMLILRESALGRLGENGSIDGFWLLGDSGYVGIHVKRNAQL